MWSKVSGRGGGGRRLVESARLVVVSVVSCLLGAAGGVAQEGAITRGPYLQSLLEDSVKVVWQTEEESIGSVRVRAEGQPPRVVVESDADTRHELRIAGLAPGSEYAYEVLVDGEVVAAGEELRFRTAPRAGTGSFRAVVIGDSGSASFGFQPAVTEILDRLEPDLFLHVGDYVYDGSIDEVFFDEYRGLLRRCGVFAARGNHDGIRPQDWYELFSPPSVDVRLRHCELPEQLCGENPPGDFVIPDPGVATYYSFDWGPVHFSVVDSNADLDGCSPQMRWLCADLAAANEREMPWKVILLHHPVYTMGLYAISRHAANRLLPPLADRYGVDLVFNGHDHNYQRSHPVRGGGVVDPWRGPDFGRPGGTVYVVTGGGGAILYTELPEAEFRPLFATFRSVHHAVELEASVDRLVLRAHAADEDGPFDEMSISKVAQETVPGFRRGDTNFDGDIDIADGVALLNVLFLGQESACRSAFDVVADVNRSDRVDIADASFVFGYLFLGGPSPGEPLERCEASPNIDASECHLVGCELPQG